MTGETTLYGRYRVPTTLLATDKGSLTQADQLPPRSKRYLNLSAASGDIFTALQAEAESDESQDHSTRPPSRQRHAFPTHLLDNRDFLSPKHDSKINVTPWHHEDEDEEEQAREEPAKTQSVATTSNSTRQERPPSRYMTKKTTIQRVNSHSSTSSSQSGGAHSPDSADGEPSGRLPSRRGGAASWNQAHHDPKTDGFAEVDESVPPPFRIEITTDSYQSQYIPASESNHRITAQDVDDVMLRRQGMLQARRWSSFGSNAQLKQQLLASMRTNVSEEAEVNHLRRPPPPREWLQRPEHPPYPTGGKAPLEPETTDCQPQRRSRESIMPPTSNNQASHQWFRSSTNPFFCASAATTTSAYEAMDFDTAIANTPLFEGDNDLMALPPLSDLHLDDFLGDPIASTAIPVPVVAAAATAGTAVSTLSAMKLHTSLGKDFLSLFAQH
ncbi:hypothetical protein Poli38472_008254 [Pythium oligandrum]|uniref:Uncharacterized protein n=1 Tax=Pythium oligandrum TaxID=41045 RepID=A0A8K1FN85_PYTOL|nr:hypothetical protein Poli38472_008254 [Pythium oligandrum]|eukprot:TMW65612.1 hypothetical protein Poli38472_008254 [Pythium oligandrum]